MMQRYRAILHLVDPLIEMGHELKLVVSDHDVNIEAYRARPCDFAASAPNTVAYLAGTIGLTIKHLDRVKYTLKKHPICDQYLGYDNSRDDIFGIPYVGDSCYWRGKTITTGNPMRDLITDDYRPNTVLILHPGGGRGYVSPIRQDWAKEITTRNNIEFLRCIIDCLPKSVIQITIKTHPAPYRRCTKSALEKFVAPNLQQPVTVEDTNLIGLINSHEYILNFGGTSALWVMGSGKKWANVTGLVKYPDSNQREKFLSARGGGVRIENLAEWFEKPAPAAQPKPNAVPKILKAMHESFGL